MEKQNRMKQYFCTLSVSLAVNQRKLFVGDLTERDSYEVKKAGLKALLIDRAREAPVNVEKIGSLREVLAYTSDV